MSEQIPNYVIQLPMNRFVIVNFHPLLCKRYSCLILGTQFHFMLQFIIYVYINEAFKVFSEKARWKIPKSKNNLMFLCTTSMFNQSLSSETHLPERLILKNTGGQVCAIKQIINNLETRTHRLGNTHATSRSNTLADVLLLQPQPQSILAECSGAGFFASLTHQLFRLSFTYDKLLNVINYDVIFIAYQPAASLALSR